MLPAGLTQTINYISFLLIHPQTRVNLPHCTDRTPLIFSGQLINVLGYGSYWLHLHPTVLLTLTLSSTKKPTPFKKKKKYDVPRSDPETAHLNLLHLLGI